MDAEERIARIDAEGVMRTAVTSLGWATERLSDAGDLDLAVTTDTMRQTAQNLLSEIGRRRDA